MTTIKDVEINPLEERVTNLENLVNALVKSRTMDKMYTEADINGTRQSVANITPTVMTQKGYIQDKEVMFENVPSGNITVYCAVPYVMYDDRNKTNIVYVHFIESLKEVIDVTISIL